MILISIEQAKLHFVSGGATKPLKIPAGLIEAWSTGDADILNSRLMTRLYNDKERLTHGKGRSVSVPIIITR